MLEGTERYSLRRAEKIVLVQDNLIHTRRPRETRHSLRRKRGVSLSASSGTSPKHGSWLDMAELELAVLSGQCLDRRIPDMTTLECEVEAWLDRRNATPQRLLALYNRRCPHRASSLYPAF